ncbi:hypothetical protein EVAR_5563_1 [Eumeta japonica]|uniref:Uncharacterized protein n=1 Tax=Eumeta variegata TaxID=151549 RepID=A0A4C1U199_EUMVA|nr:hypothetical protein EVAR_5563_1 [Eumeta japonica]
MATSKRYKQRNLRSRRKSLTHSKKQQPHTVYHTKSDDRLIKISKDHVDEHATWQGTSRIDNLTRTVVCLHIAGGKTANRSARALTSGNITQCKTILDDVYVTNSGAVLAPHALPITTAGRCIDIGPRQCRSGSVGRTASLCEGCHA